MILQSAIIWSLVGGGVIEPLPGDSVRYRAPTTASGTALVIARCPDCTTTKRDTAVVRFVGGSTAIGIPFGHFAEPNPGTTLRTGGDLIVPQGHLTKLPMIRARGGRVVVNVLGGGACSVRDGQWRMDLWQACWRLNLTPALRDTVLRYAADGVVIGTYLIDEPNLLKRWGVITPQQTCDMARHAKAELPGIPVLIRASATFIGSCDAIDAVWSQYGSRRGIAVDAYREEQLAASRRYGYAQVFSLNALNDDASGTDMTPAQVTTYGTALMKGEPCLFMVWEYARDWSERPEIRVALDSLGRIAAGLPATSCRRPS